VAGAATMSKPNPELDALVKAAVDRFNALSPAEQAAHRRAQRRSWVIGEMGIEHPEMSREEIERLVDAVVG